MLFPVRFVTTYSHHVYILRYRFVASLRCLDDTRPVLVTLIINKRACGRHQLFRALATKMANLFNIPVCAIRLDKTSSCTTHVKSLDLFSPHVAFHIFLHKEEYPRWKPQVIRAKSPVLFFGVVVATGENDAEGCFLR